MGAVCWGWGWLWVWVFVGWRVVFVVGVVVVGWCGWLWWVEKGNSWPWWRWCLVLYIRCLAACFVGVVEWLLWAVCGCLLADGLFHDKQGKGYHHDIDLELLFMRFGLGWSRVRGYYHWYGSGLGKCIRSFQWAIMSSHACAFTKTMHQGVCQVARCAQGKDMKRHQFLKLLNFFFRPDARHIQRSVSGHLSGRGVADGEAEVS